MFGSRTANLSAFPAWAMREKQESQTDHNRIRIMNTEDKSWSLTPELLYTGITNWEFRLRTGIIAGARNSDFGEKQNDYRVELRVGYYF